MRARTLRLLLLVALALSILLSMSFGAVHVSMWDFLLGDPMAQGIVMQFRLPRTLVGALVGAELAAAGAILQAITRNPLADPHITGVSNGASFVAVLILLALPGFPVTALPATALVGGLGAGILVWLVAWKKGGLNPGRLALSGIAVGAVLSAGTSALLLQHPIGANASFAWLAGGFWGRNWDHVRALLPWALSLLVLAWLLGPRIDLLALGDDVARGNGLSVERNRTLLLALAVLLAASAVAIAGPIGFVGLVIPHLARLLVGAPFRRLLPVTALLGATLVVLADALGRTLFAPTEIPAGVFTALVGAPYFLHLLRRTAL
jgi:ABC-type Fe3+-siderophore transport system permease subunit